MRLDPVGELEAALRREGAEVWASDFVAPDRPPGELAGVRDRLAVRLREGAPADLAGEFDRLRRGQVRLEQDRARAVEAAPTAYLVGELDSLPAPGPRRDAWRAAAGAVEAYRERWGVAERGSALGPEAGHSAGVQHNERAEVRAVLEEAKEALRPELARTWVLERGRQRGRDLGRGR